MNFDRLAPYYYRIERFFAGNRLQYCRTALINEIPKPEHVLILGEGNGRFLVSLLKVHPTAEVSCVEGSSQMIKLARERLIRDGIEPESVNWIQTDAMEWQPPPGQYDLVVTLFFLDCFRPEQLAELIPKLATATKPSAHWLLSDFREPPSGLARWRGRFALWGLYRFFRWVTKLSASRLTPPDAFLRNAGFVLIERRLQEWGLLHSDLWKRTSPNSQAHIESQ